MNQLITQLNNIADTWSHFVWSSSWQSALLVVVLLLVVLLGRKISAPVRYGILLVALVKFAVPPFMHVPSGVFSTVSVTQPTIEVIETNESNLKTDQPLFNDRPTIQEPIPEYSSAANAVPGSVRTPDAVIVESSAALASPPRMEAAAPSPTLLAADSQEAEAPGVVVSSLGWLMLIHLAGSLLLLIVLLVKLHKLSRLKHRADELDCQSVRKIFAETCRQLNLRSEPRLLVSSEIDSPISFGCWQPVVMLPQGMQHQTEHCSIVFAHELAHLKRLDPWFNGLQNLLFACWWFNPLLWVLNWQIRKLREDCCDDLVLANQFFSGEDYSRSLIEIARFSHQQRSLTIQTAFSMAEHPLKDRIRRIMNPATRRARRISWLGAMLMLVLGVVCLPGIRNVIASPDSPDDTGLVDNSSSPLSDREIQEGENQQQETDEQEGEAGGTSFRFKVVDKDLNPIVGANIYCSIVGDREASRPSIEKENFTTDEDGIAVIELFEGANSLRTWTSKDSMVTMFTNWEDFKFDPVPELFTLKMQKATSVGGRIVDSQGNPVEDVRVEVMRSEGGDKLDETGRAKLGTWLSEGDSAVRTDENGKWKITNVPSGQVDLRFKLTHPDYLADISWQSMAHFASNLEQLRDESASFTVSQGFSISGRIFDPAGEPVHDALIVWGDQPYWEGGSQETRSDEEGVFKTQALEPGEHRLTVVAKNWMPQSRMVRIGADTNEKQNFDLQPGKTLHLKFVDEAGNALPNTYVNIEQWRGASALYNTRHPNILESYIPNSSNKEGEYVWDWAPDDEIDLVVLNREIKATINRQITASDEVQVIVIKRPFQFMGSVVDASSGEAIKEYTITPITYSSKAAAARGIAQSHYKKKFANSEFVYDNVFPGTDREQVAFRVEAVGFKGHTSERYSYDSPSNPVEIRLTPATVTQASVVDQQGDPVEGARSWLVLPNDSLMINKYSDYFEEMSGTPNTTDTDGMVKFSTPESRFAVVTMSNDGYAEKYCQPGEKVGQLILQPWASMEGQLLQDGEPVADANVMVNPIRNLGGDNPHVQDNFQTKTDSNGRFYFKKLPPVAVTVSSILTAWRDYPITSNPIVSMNLKPGENHKVNLGAEGLKVIGQAKVKGQGSELIEYRYGINNLVSMKPAIPLPDHVNNRFRYEAGEQAQFEKRLWGEEGSSGRQSHFVKLNDDGTFLINGVEPGSYRFLIKLYEPPEGCLVDPVGYAFLEFSTEDYQSTDGSIDLGELEVKIRPIQKAGEVLSNFSYRELDGTKRYLSEHRGKYVLLDFWASWCTPCIASIPDIKSLNEKLKGSEEATLLSISLDKDAELVKELVKKESIDWPQGIVGDIQSSSAGSALGVSSVPLYVLLDPDGKIVTRTSSFLEASNSLQKVLNPDDQ